MKLLAHHVLLTALLLLSLASLAYGLNYMYFSENEITRIGSHVCVWHGDTLNGPVRSNSGLFVIQDPVFLDWYITGADTFEQCEGIPPQPQVFGPPPVFNAPLLMLPTQATWIRGQALVQGLFLSGGDSLRARVVLGNQTLRLWWLRIGTASDTVSFAEFTLLDSAAFFFDCPQVDLSGTVASTLIIGARGRVGLADNVLYASSDPLTGAPAAGHTEKLAVVAEGEIKVLNTWANGRENSHGRGYTQTDPDSTDIALNGVYVALNESFTFEQQNDADSGYVCPCTPDDRGTIYLHGSLIQKRRGHLHRSTLNSTGYLRYHRYDAALRDWDLHLVDARENELDHTIIDFGSIALGETARDTLTLYNDYVPLMIDTFLTAAPFTGTPPLDTLPIPQPVYTWNPRIALSFAPASAGNYETEVQIPLDYYNTQITLTLRGTCTASELGPHLDALPHELGLSVSPNPFNATTHLSFTVPRAGVVTLRIYDTLGREVATLWDGAMEPGTRRLNFSGAALGTGLYFARLQTDEGAITHKLLLLK